MLKVLDISSRYEAGQFSQLEAAEVSGSVVDERHAGEERFLVG